MSQNFKAPTPLSPPSSPTDAHTQKMAQDYLDSQDAYAAAADDAAAEVAAKEAQLKCKRTRRMATSKDDDDANNDDDDDVNEDEASQVLMDEPQEWEMAGNVRPIPISQLPPPTLANMIFRLRHGSIHARLHEENKDHVFTLMSNNLGKPILLFAQGMGQLVNTVLPEAYDAYDKNIEKIDELEEGKVVYSNAFVTSKYVKNLVEVSVFRGKLYVFLKRMGKPEAYLNSPLFKKRNVNKEPYNGPKLTPDEDGFVFTKGGSITFDRFIDDPARMLIWAMQVRSMPY